MSLNDEGNVFFSPKEEVADLVEEGNKVGILKILVGTWREFHEMSKLLGKLVFLGHLDP